MVGAVSPEPMIGEHAGRRSCEEPVRDLRRASRPPVRRDAGHGCRGRPTNQRSRTRGRLAIASATPSRLSLRAGQLAGVRGDEQDRHRDAGVDLGRAVVPQALQHRDVAVEREPRRDRAVRRGPRSSRARPGSRSRASPRARSGCSPRSPSRCEPGQPRRRERLAARLPARETRRTARASRRRRTRSRGRAPARRSASSRTTLPPHDWPATTGRSSPSARSRRPGRPRRSPCRTDRRASRIGRGRAGRP